MPDTKSALMCGVESSTEAVQLRQRATPPPKCCRHQYFLAWPTGARSAWLLECAAQNGARAAAAHARSQNAARPVANNTLAGAGNSTDALGVFAVLLATDAPALKCVLEAGPLGASGRALITPSRLGHVQYAS